MTSSSPVTSTTKLYDKLELPLSPTSKTTTTTATTMTTLMTTQTTMSTTNSAGAIKDPTTNGQPQQKLDVISPVKTYVERVAASTQSKKADDEHKQLEAHPTTTKAPIATADTSLSTHLASTSSTNETVPISPTIKKRSSSIRSSLTNNCDSGYVWYVESQDDVSTLTNNGLDVSPSRIVQHNNCININNNNDTIQQDKERLPSSPPKRRSSITKKIQTIALHDEGHEQQQQDSTTTTTASTTTTAIVPKHSTDMELQQQQQQPQSPQLLLQQQLVWYMEQFVIQTKDNDSLREQIGTLQKQLSEITTNHVDLTTQHITLQKQNYQIKQEWKQLKTKDVTTTEELNRAQYELQQKVNQVKRQWKRIDELESTVQESQKQHKAVEMELQSVTAERNQVLLELVMMQKQVRALDNVNVELQTAKEGLEGDLREEQSKTEQLLEEQLQLKQQLQTGAETNELLSSKLDGMDIDLNEKTTRIEELEMEIVNQVIAREDLTTKLNSTNQCLVEVGHEMETLQEEVETLRRTAPSRHGEDGTSQPEDHIDQLTIQLDEKQNVIDKLNHILQLKDEELERLCFTSMTMERMSEQTDLLLDDMDALAESNDNYKNQLRETQRNLDQQISAVDNLSKVLDEKDRTIYTLTERTTDRQVLIEKLKGDKFRLTQQVEQEQGKVLALESTLASLEDVDNDKYAQSLKLQKEMLQQEMKVDDINFQETGKEMEQLLKEMEYLEEDITKQDEDTLGEINNNQSKIERLSYLLDVQDRYLEDLYRLEESDMDDKNNRTVLEHIQTLESDNMKLLQTQRESDQQLTKKDKTITYLKGILMKYESRDRTSTS